MNRNVDLLLHHYFKLERKSRRGSVFCRIF